MVLAWQNLDVVFANGIDSKFSRFKSPQGKLDRLENAVFRQTGQVDKRKGFDTMPLDRTDGGTIPAIASTAVYRDQLLAFSGYQAFAWLEAAEKWKPLSAVTSATVDERPVVKNGTNQSAPDVGIAGGLELYAYEALDAAGNVWVHYTVLNESTGAVVVPDTAIEQGGRPRVVAAGATIHVFWGVLASNQLRVASYDTAALSLSVASNVGTANWNESYTNIDAIYSGGKIYVAHCWKSGDAYNQRTKVYKLSAAAVVETSELIDMRCEQAVGLFVDGDPTIVNVLAAGGGNPNPLDGGFVRIAACRASDLVVLAGPTNVETLGATVNIINVCGAAAPAGGGYSYVFTSRQIDQAYAGRYNLTTKTTMYRSGGGTWTVSVATATLCGWTQIVARPVALASVVYVPCSTVTGVTALQNTIVLLSLYGNIAGVAAAWNADVESFTLGSVWTATISNTAVSGSALRFAHTNKGGVDAVGGVLVPLRGVSQCRMNFGANVYRKSVVGDQLFVAGDTLRSYDGAALVEHGFLAYPETCPHTSADTGGHIAAGTYRYRFVYRWRDMRGQVHESAPSPVFVVTHATGSVNKVTFYVQSLHATGKTGVQIVGYRTQAESSNDPTYYRFTPNTAPTANDSTAGYTAVVDDGTYFNTSNDFLYTTGGVFSNDAPPTCKTIATYRNRLWLAGTDNGAIWYSQYVAAGTPVRFSQNLTMSFDLGGGGVTAMAAMDDHLILFTPSAIYRMAGEGPTATGAQNDYQDPQLVTSDTGCDNPDSVVMTPVGLMFQSPKGIYLLSRAFECKYAGASVEQYNGETVTSATLMPDANEVRFATTGRILVYNYFYDQWSTFTVGGPVSSGLWRGTYFYALSDGIHLENGTYLDDGESIAMAIQTGWLSFAGIQGYQRVRDFLIIGDQEASGPSDIDKSSQLLVTVYRDYVEPTGAETPTLIEYMAGAPVQWRVFLKNPRCQAIKIRVEQPPVVDGHRPGRLSLSALSFSVGGERGHFRLPATKQVGAA